MFSQNVSLKNKQNFQKNGCKDNFFTFNVYESNSADAFSLLSVSSYPPNGSLSQVEVGDDGTLFGIQNPGVNASTYMFKLENGNFVKNST